MKHKTGHFIKFEGKKETFLIIGKGNENGYFFFFIKSVKNGHIENMLEDFVNKKAKLQQFNIIKYFILFITTLWKK